MFFKIDFLKKFGVFTEKHPILETIFKNAYYLKSHYSQVFSKADLKSGETRHS